MIQRLQTIYLSLVVILFIILFFVPVYGVSTGVTEFYALGSFPKLALVMAPLAVLAVLAIFMYKNRKLQLRLCRAGMILSIILSANQLLFSKWYAGSIAGDQELLYGIGTWLLPLNIIFFFLAARGVKKDEELVRSADRLR